MEKVFTKFKYQYNNMVKVKQREVDQYFNGEAESAAFLCLFLMLQSSSCQIKNQNICKGTVLQVVQNFCFNSSLPPRVMKAANACTSDT